MVDVNIKLLIHKFAMENIKVDMTRENKHRSSILK